MMRKTAIFYFIVISLSCYTQDEMITKLNRRDSIRSNKIASLYRKNNITNEIHNVLFRNIYPTKSYNEEEAFKQEIDRLAPFNNKLIDTIIIVQLNAFGESVYDTSIQSNKFEYFISNSLHVNTRQKVIRNRYLFMNEGNLFSSYTAYENARLIRSSGIFHDVRIEALISGTDSQKIILVYRIQDLFPYGFSLGLNGSKDVSFGIENANIAGWNHRVNTDFRINTFDNHQLFGYGIRYTIPNLINKSFIDGFAQYRNVRLENSLELGVFREFVRPEFRWAGGNIFSYREIGVLDGFDVVPNNFIENNVWISHALPFKSQNTTINAIIGGIGLNTVQHLERPKINLNERFKYSNTNLFLVNLGYSRVKFMQDRLLNGFGRAEDIPIGISLNTLFGIDMNEHGTRKYYGGQVLGQYNTGKGYYVNMNVRLGFFSSETEASQGVWDFNFQQVSRAYKLGGFRLRNYFRMRTTIGVNQDIDIRLNDYDGIRGIRNTDFFGRSRFTTGFQSNLFIPFTFMGFRFSVFALGELAKIQPSFDDFFQTAIQSGLTAGIAIKNENLIFDVIQIQYGLYPSTSSLSQRGLVLTSILPFNFQKLDISRPRIVLYE